MGGVSDLKILDLDNNRTFYKVEIFRSQSRTNCHCVLECNNVNLHSAKFVVLFYGFVSDSVQGSLIAVCIGRSLQCGFSYNAVTWLQWSCLLRLRLKMRGGR